MEKTIKIIKAGISNSFFKICLINLFDKYLKWRNISLYFRFQLVFLTNDHLIFLIQLFEKAPDGEVPDAGSPH